MKPADVLAMDALGLFSELRVRAQLEGVWTPEQEAASADLFADGYARHVRAPTPLPFPAEKVPNP